MDAFQSGFNGFLGVLAGIGLVLIILACVAALFAFVEWCLDVLHRR